MIYQYKENKFKTFMADSAALLLMMSYFFIMFGINWDEVNSKTRLNLAKEARIPFFVVMSIPMVFIPMGGMARRKRAYTTRIETTRKGFKIDCTGQKRVFTWFEMKNATIIYNTTLTRQIYPRKIILRQGQPPKVDIIELDNEPYGIELPNIVEFVKEILEHEPKTPQELIGAENYCPWHGHYDGGACHVCKSRIKAPSRWIKLFYTVKPEYIFLTAGFSLLGPEAGGFALVMAILAIALPLIMAIKTDRIFANAKKDSEKPVMAKTSEKGEKDRARNDGERKEAPDSEGDADKKEGTDK